jgi:hypothetical protein
MIKMEQSLKDKKEEDSKLLQIFEINSIKII